MYVFIFLVKFGLLSGCLFGNGCSLGLRYVSWYKYLSVINIFVQPLGMWNENFYLIGPFPDHCLLVLFYPKKSNMLFAC